jgi:hypothetical protein
MVSEILNSTCLDKTLPFQSKGDVATYYLEISTVIKKMIKVRKYNADCIKKKLNTPGKICDSFFYLKKGGKSQLKDKWILVENKGEKYKHAILQLDNSLVLFKDTKSPIHGRIVGRSIPSILPSTDRGIYDNLQQKFVAAKGDLRMGNVIMREKIININNSDIYK